MYVRLIKNEKKRGREKLPKRDMSILLNVHDFNIMVCKKCFSNSYFVVQSYNYDP